MNDKKNWRGIIYLKKANIKYEFDFVNDNFEGNGKYIYENGEYYVGQWLNGKTRKT